MAHLGYLLTYLFIYFLYSLRDFMTQTSLHDPFSFCYYQLLIYFYLLYCYLFIYYLLIYLLLFYHFLFFLLLFICSIYFYFYVFVGKFTQERGGKQELPK